MGVFLSRPKKEEGGKKFYQFWSGNSEPKSPSKRTLKLTKSQDLIEKSPSQNSDWTEVPLAVPEVDLIQNDKNVTERPVPPPRRHRGKSPTFKVVIEKMEAVQSTPSQNVHSVSPDARVAVEEPIIIPKKEPVHICDGTHHHVMNIANGKVIHDTHITPKSHTHQNHERHAHKTEKEKHTRPKNLSTVSLPNYEELSVKPSNKKKLLNKSSSNKKVTRHISVVSLPTDNKYTLSAETAARLENYIMRCKSFGSLPPRKLLEKLQSQMSYSSDSDDSWEGVDDWDMEIIEHSGVRHSPVIPKSRLVAPQNSNSMMVVNENRLPTTIEEVEEVSKKNVPIPVPQGIITLKKTGGRRESIDDFFDSKAENPLSKVVKITTENYLGRRGSDSFFGYDKINLPIKNSKNDSLSTEKFYSNALLQSESQNTQTAALIQRRKSAGAALHRIDSKDSTEDDDDDIAPKPETNPSDTDDLLASFKDFYSSKSEEKNTLNNDHKIEKKHRIDNSDQHVVSEITENIKPLEQQLQKKSDKEYIKASGEIEHSCLLNFLQKNGTGAMNDKTASTE